MLYSGADLIRTSGLQAERLDRLQAADDSIQPTEPPQKIDDPSDESTQGALLRFARFVHKEGEKKKRPKSQVLNPGGGGADPYRKAETHQQSLFERGQQLDVYI